MSISETAPVSSGALWTGRVLSGIIILFMVVSMSTAAQVAIEQRPALKTAKRRALACRFRLKPPYNKSRMNSQAS